MVESAKADRAAPATVDGGSAVQLELLAPVVPVAPLAAAAMARLEVVQRRDTEREFKIDIEPEARLRRELWLALHLPGIVFEALQDEFSGTGPRAVLESAERTARVLVADEAARRFGIRPGLALAAALALCSTLETRVRDLAREQVWLERAATLALGFTSRVSLEPPDGLLLEIRGSVRLFGGLEALCGQIEAACHAARMHPRCAVAPTPLAALAGARAGRALRITSLSRLAGALAPLPLAALRWDEDTLARLAAVGARTVGEVLRLPRAGFARRFGAARLALLDRLAGRRAEARRGFQAAERFRGRFELDHELESLEAVLAALAPLLLDLEHFLETRQRGVTVIRCRLRHRDRPPSCCLLRLAAPEARAAQFARLLRERLGTLSLPAPVRRGELRTGPLLPRPLANEALWRPGEHGGDGAGQDALAFIDQLRARLGREGVYSLGLHADHRPERIARVCEPGSSIGPAATSATSGISTTGATGTTGTTGAIAAMPAALGPMPAASSLPWSATCRPLWLLAAPLALAERQGLPIRDGLLELVRGPERIETGWWDGADVTRDYYVARDRHGAWLWIFRDRAAPHGWFLHGCFG